MKLPDNVAGWMEDHKPPPFLSDDDLTIKSAAKFWGTTTPKAKEILEAGVEAGELKVEKRMSANYKEVDTYVLTENGS